MSDVLVSAIPIVGIVFGVGFPLAVSIVTLVLRHKTRRQLIERYHAERMAAIEHGMELPPWSPELLESQSKPRRPRTSLLPGLVWFFIGIALLFVLRVAADEGRYLGLIPAAVGLAYLVYYFVEGREIERKQIDEELKKG
ncbi:MAG TPA: DUF6249 domain-containing protein [Steroidobacteraceae bacterium]|nr:DUF6249 domain-containing protein [Steroidobacteraceae bacterium]